MNKRMSYVKPVFIQGFFKPKQKVRKIIKTLDGFKKLDIILESL